MSLVWLITGCSAGIGLELAKVAALRGDKVIATARTLSKIQHLAGENIKLLELDVTASVEELNAKAKEAERLWGQAPDVLVNNAGFSSLGAVETASIGYWQKQYDTNVFGLIKVTQAFLPGMRARKTGWVLNIGSQGSFRTLGGGALYNSSKYAVRSITEALAGELAPFGIKAVCICPGFVRTLFLSAATWEHGKAPVDGPYAELEQKIESTFGKLDGTQAGDPIKCGEAMHDLVHSTGLAKGKPLPTSVLLGSDAVALVKGVLEQQLKEIEEWKEFSSSTMYK